jgi:transcription elongation GreA/GreB family factor
MSVAFRREGDEEHLEPKFEIPIPPGPNLVTPRGLALIGARVAALEAEIGGLDEGTELERAKRDLRYWHTRQVTAEIAPLPDGQTVEIGTRVRFRLRGEERSIATVGHDEADPAAGLLAFSAPLSRAMLGGFEGDVVEFAGDSEAIEIVSIEVPSQA